MLDKWWIKKCDFCDWIWDMSENWAIQKTYVMHNGKTYCSDCRRKQEEEK